MPLTKKSIEKLLAETTPGPWVVRSDCAGGQDEMYGYWHSVGPLELPGKEPDANSLLAAAAPELAKICLELLSALESSRKEVIEEVIEAVQSIELEFLTHAFGCDRNNCDICRIHNAHVQMRDDVLSRIQELKEK